MLSIALLPSKTTGYSVALPTEKPEGPFFWGADDSNIAAGSPLRLPFAGYLEIDGVPIGPKMRLDELQRRRAKQGLPQLRRDSLTGEYFTYEKDRYSQLYFFDDDGVLAHVQLL